MVVCYQRILAWRENGEKPNIDDPSLYDMACAWGLIFKPETADDGVQEQNSVLGNSAQSQRQEPTTFADGKTLLGVDLGAKGAMHMDGFSNFGRISRGIRGK